MLILDKPYYNLKELIPIVNLQYRQLKIRVKSIEKKYSNNKLLFKKSNKWHIHQSIVKDFLRIRKPIDYKLFITIGSEYNYDKKYWKELISDVNKQLKSKNKRHRLKYVIERTKKQIHHIHFITTYDRNRELKKIILNHKWYDSPYMNTKIKYVWNMDNLNDYFKKENKPVLLK